MNYFSIVPSINISGLARRKGEIHIMCDCRLCVYKLNCVHTPTTQRGIVRQKEESGHTVVKDLTGLTDF